MSFAIRQAVLTLLLSSVQVQAGEQEPSVPVVSAYGEWGGGEVPQVGEYVGDATILADEMIKRAEQGDTAAQKWLSRAYAEGDGVPQSWEKAARWLEEGADQGDALAQIDLAYAYADGKVLSQSDARNDKVAVEWFQKAAAQGNAHAKEVVRLLKIEPGYLARWRKLREKKVFDVKDSAAQRQLGYRYLVGEGVEPSSEMAAKWYQLAAEQGDAEAQEILGAMYAAVDGDRGVTPNRRTAAKWIQKAAEQGRPGERWVHFLGSS
jgi:TPR repeat protein